MVLMGAGLAPDDVLTCKPILVPRAGTRVVTTLELTWEGQEWVGRAALGIGGSLELRFHGTGLHVMGVPAVEGLISGAAVDLGIVDVIPPRDVRIDVSGVDGSKTAELRGRVGASTFLLGEASGAIRFSDSGGDTSICPFITWTLNRLP
jgi:hypothetical protein